MLELAQNGHSAVIPPYAGACELNGISAMCPAQSEKYLSATYGADWRVPKGRADQGFRERVVRADVHPIPSEMKRNHEIGTVGERAWEAAGEEQEEEECAGWCHSEDALLSIADHGCPSACLACPGCSKTEEGG